MDTNKFLDLFPLWVLFLITVVIVYLSVEFGYRLARYRRQRSTDEDEPGGAMAGAILGLLAFMMAFTFGLAASRYEDRRQVVLDEANAIGTTYLRAAMLPEPMRTETRNLLRDYTDARLEGASGGKVAEAITRSEQLQEQLWSQAVAVTEKDRTPIAAIYVQSLNDVIDLHAKRVMVGVRSRVPGAIWLTLYLLSVLAMAAMGYQEGSTGVRRSIARFALVFGFSLVLILNMNLDRPGQGLLQVSQQSMIDLRNSMR